MTLPTSGNISMVMVAQELSIGAGGLNLNDSRVRALAGRPSGAISMADLRGKSAYVPMTLSLVNDNEGFLGMVWEPVYNDISSYNYTCGFSVRILNGAGPFNIVMGVANSQGTFGAPAFVDKGNGIATWTIRVPKSGDYGAVFASGTFQATVTDSKGITASISQYGYASGGSGN